MRKKCEIFLKIQKKKKKKKHKNWRWEIIKI